MDRKAFVLLSGGLDSTTCLHKAIFDFMPNDALELDLDAIRNADPGDFELPWVEAISIYYGQRHKRELEYAATTCKRLGIKHTILDIGDILKGKNILLSGDSVGAMDMVHMSYDDIKGVSPSYVPYRNGLLLSCIAAHAQKWVNEQIDAKAKLIHDLDLLLGGNTMMEARNKATVAAKDISAIYFGAHAEDAANWAYPDCTPEFIGAQANAIYIGSYQTIRLVTPLEWLLKSDIVTLGEKHGVDWVDTWSCYDNGEVHCGRCPTCLARKKAFQDAGVPDPTIYAVDFEG